MTLICGYRFCFHRSGDHRRLDRRGRAFPTRRSSDLTPEHLNAGGACQGGAIYTLADTAFAFAANSHLQMTVTASSTISFFRPATTGYLYAEARETVNQHRLPFVLVEVTDVYVNLIANYTASG